MRRHFSLCKRDICVFAPFSFYPLARFGWGGDGIKGLGVSHFAPRKSPPHILTTPKNGVRAANGMGEEREKMYF